MRRIAREPDERASAFVLVGGHGFVASRAAAQCDVDDGPAHAPSFEDAATLSLYSYTQVSVLSKCALLGVDKVCPRRVHAWWKLLSFPLLILAEGCFVHCCAHRHRQEFTSDGKPGFRSERCALALLFRGFAKTAFSPQFCEMFFPCLRPLLELVNIAPFQRLSLTQYFTDCGCSFLRSRQRDAMQPSSRCYY
eukprot:3280950-Pleurochrysis_carterae.AAC.2